MNINLNKDEVEILDLLLENEIKSNEDYFSDIKGEELNYFCKITDDLKKLKEKISDYVEYSVFIQEIKIDDMIECEIDDLIAKRHERKKND